MAQMEVRSWPGDWHANGRFASRTCASSIRGETALSMRSRDRPGDQARRVLRLARPQRRGQDDHRRDPGGAESARRPARSRSWACSWSTDEVAIRERIGVTLQETRFPDKETVHEIVSLFRSFYKSGIEPRRRDRAGCAREQGERLHRAALRRPAAAAGRRDRAGRRPRDSCSWTSRRPGWTRNRAGSSGT